MNKKKLHLRDIQPKQASLSQRLPRYAVSGFFGAGSFVLVLLLIFLFIPLKPQVSDAHVDHAPIQMSFVKIEEEVKEEVKVKEPEPTPPEPKVKAVEVIPEIKPDAKEKVVEKIEEVKIEVKEEVKEIKKVVEVKKTEDVRIKAVVRKEPKNPDPRYPRIALKRDWQGTVQLRVTINAYGRVSAVTIFKSSGHAVLDKSALETIKTWHFTPATVNGVAVESQLTIPVVFEISN